MRTSVKLLAALGVLAVVIMSGIMLGWFGGKRQQSSAIPSRRTNETVSSNSLSVDLNPRPKPVGPKPNLPVPSSNAVVPVPAASANLITNWEERLDMILGSEGEESDKAKQLLSIFYRLPEDGQVEVAQHLSNLVSDQDYEPLGKLLVDASLPEDVLEQLMADVLNRPNSLKLPRLLEVARNPQHAKAEDAKDLLELYLEEDYGQDWTKWQVKVDEWVKANPD